MAGHAPGPGRLGAVAGQCPPARARPGKGPLALRVGLSGGGGFDVTEQGTEKRLALWVVRDLTDVDGRRPPRARPARPGVRCGRAGGAARRSAGQPQDGPHRPVGAGRRRQRLLRRGAARGQAVAVQAGRQARPRPRWPPSTPPWSVCSATPSSGRSGCQRRASRRRSAAAWRSTAGPASPARCAATPSGRCRSPPSRCSTARPARRAASPGRPAAVPAAQVTTTSPRKTHPPGIRWQRGSTSGRPPVLRHATASGGWRGSRASTRRPLPPGWGPVASEPAAWSGRRGAAGWRLIPVVLIVVVLVIAVVQGLRPSGNQAHKEATRHGGAARQVPGPERDGRTGTPSTRRSRCRATRRRPPSRW